MKTRRNRSIQFYLVIQLALALMSPTAVCAIEPLDRCPFPVEEADVWVLAGQSNMQGYGLITGQYMPNPKVAIFDLSGNWNPAIPPTHRIVTASSPAFKKQIFTLNPSLTEEGWQQMIQAEKTKPTGGVGPDLSFAEAVVSATGRNVILVPCALGGTTLEQWSPALKDEGTASLYGNMLERIRKVGGNIKGILWYQGESQTSRRETVDAFEANLLEFIDSIRHDTKNPDLPFIYVQIGRFCPENRDSEPLWQMIQEKQRALAKQRNNLWVVPSVDLPLDDVIHIGTAGQHRLGRRLAEVALTHVYKLPGFGTPIDYLSCEVLPGSDAIHHSLRVKFSGVTGRLQSRGRPSGFQLQSDHSERDGPMVYNIEFDPSDPSAIIVWYSKKIKAAASLTYALGMDRYANLVDERDMAVPAFGPILIEP